MISVDPYDLAYQWGSAYDLSFDGKVWVAERRGSPQHTLMAGSVAEMRDLLRQDYFDWKMPL